MQCLHEPADKAAAALILGIGSHKLSDHDSKQQQQHKHASFTMQQYVNIIMQLMQMLASIALHRQPAEATVH